MKYLLCIIVIALSFTACKKWQQPDQQNCYTCIKTDSVTSNIPKLAKAHYSTEVDTKCSYTEALKNYYIKTTAIVDTLFYRNDTVELNHFAVTCTIQ